MPSSELRLVFSENIVIPDASIVSTGLVSLSPITLKSTPSIASDAVPLLENVSLISEFDASARPVSVLNDNGADAVNVRSVGLPFFETETGSIVYCVLSP